MVTTARLSATLVPSERGSTERVPAVFPGLHTPYDYDKK